MEKKLYYTLLTLLTAIIIALLVIAAPPNGHDLSDITFDQTIPLANIDFSGGILDIEGKDNFQGYYINQEGVSGIVSLSRNKDNSLHLHRHSVGDIIGANADNTKV